jgi:hypothetical protein
VADQHDELRPPGAALSRSGQQCRIGVGEVAFERLPFLLRLGRARTSSGFRFGPRHHGRANVRFQREMDVDHPEFVAVAPGAASRSLAHRQVSVLFRFELCLAGPALETWKASF